jgi:DNA repair protein SbcC/Rad50
VRPLKLDVQGFTAFREPQTVHFENLDLFTITGPTGAGKTSLLDAMIFALYGKVPRMGGQGLPELVSQGLTEARISLEFAVSGSRYRVARRLRRDGRGSGATFERSDGDDWLTDVETSGVKAVTRRIEELIKLDFDAFTRAVVLPQGEFQRFLRGERDERREVLTNLLGLEYFLTMGRRARARANELKVGAETTLKILAEQYGDATPERVKESKADAKEAKKRALALTRAAQTATTLDARAAILRKGKDAIEHQIEDLGDIHSKLHNKIAACQAAGEQERASEAAITKARKRCDQAGTSLSTARSGLQALVAKHGSREELTVAEGALRTRDQCRGDLVKKTERLEALSSQIDGIVKELNKARAQADKLGRARDGAQTGTEGIQASCDRATEKARTADDLLRQAEEATNELREARQEANQARREHDAAVQLNKSAAAELAGAQTAYDQVARADLVTTLAQGLKVGDPCPVCERALDSEPHIEGHAAQLIAEAQEALGRARGVAEDANNSHASAAAAARSTQSRMAKAEKALQRTLGKTGDLKSLRVDTKAAHKLVDERNRELDRARIALEQAIEAAADARVSTETLATTLMGRRSAHEDLEDECKELRGRLATATETLAVQFKGSLPADAGSLLAEWKTKVAAATTAVDSAKDEASEAQTQLQGATEALSELRRELSQLDVEISRLRGRCETIWDAITTTLKSVSFSHELFQLLPAAPTRETHVGELIKWCDGVAAMLTNADRHCEAAVLDLEQRLTTLAEDHDVAVERGSTASDALRAAAQAAHDDQLRREAAVDEAQRRLTERDELKASVAASQAEIQILSVLVAELRADRFIQFVIQQTLDLLAVRASEQLRRISSERYSLISHEGEFYVIDHVNADEQRSVKTLSGGETFLASLSLALALSQHVGELATEGLGAKLEAVFIDEGFDQLDSETLQDVIDALERLREGNLMVGVITHIPALAERIQVGLRVEKHANQSNVLVAA